MIGRARALVLAALAAGAVACGGSDRVARVVDGRRVDGPFIEPEAYAEMLRGALAEEDGALDAALRAYERAHALDEDDPEILVRIAEVRCKREEGRTVLARRDPEIARAIGRALDADPSYAPALAVRARCVDADPSAALASAREAARQAPRDLDTAFLLAKAEGEGPATRDRLLALTLTHPSAAAFDALGAWAVTHDDAGLAVHAFSQVALRDPKRRPVVAARAQELAGVGDLAAARALAGALVDVGIQAGDRSSGGLGPAPASVPLVARLAVDDALARGDADLVLARAAAGHVGRAEVGARALLLGRAQLARALTAPVVLADPSDVAARVVAAIASGAEPEPPRGATLPAAVALVYARSSAPGGALSAMGHLLAGDALLTGLAVDLAARGTIGEDELPLDARIELGVRRRAVSLPEGDTDPRHTLLRLSQVAPRSTEAIALGRRLAPRAAHDALVGAALVRLATAAGRALDAPLRERLVALSASDPVLCVALLEALPAADPAPAAAVRASLRRLAATPAERALSL